jgi:hypothetical protein
MEGSPFRPLDHNIGNMVGKGVYDIQNYNKKTIHIRGGHVVFSPWSMCRLHKTFNISSKPTVDQ